MTVVNSLSIRTCPVDTGAASPQGDRPRTRTEYTASGRVRPGPNGPDELALLHYSAPPRAVNEGRGFGSTFTDYGTYAQQSGARTNHSSARSNGRVGCHIASNCISGRTGSIPRRAAPSDRERLWGS